MTFEGCGKRPWRPRVSRRIRAGQRQYACRSLRAGQLRPAGAGEPQYVSVYQSDPAPYRKQRMITCAIITRMNIVSG